ncbi:MAG: type I restriction-modification enzyme R subunit C-terminal domain-containing protein [Pseudomonadales bacterium]
MNRFQMKVRHFLKEHQNHIAIQKLRRNEPLTEQDIRELERIFVEAGITELRDLEKVKVEVGLGVFVRTLVGLDREAAKRAFDDFQVSRTLSADQIEFLNMIIDYLTERGVMDPRLLYESPFTDFDAMGVEGVFDSSDVVALIDILEDVRTRAAA